MPEVKFVVYGGISVPSYYQRCLELRRDLGLDDHFIFAGHVSDVPSAYASGDLVVLSSISEGFPYAVIEAMMSGRPVVATDVGGTREACEGVGLLVQPQNPVDMATAMLRLLGDDHLRLQMAEEGRQRALSHFTIQKNLDLYRKAYTLLANKTTAEAAAVVPVDRYRQLSIDRAQALITAGHIRQASEAYRHIVDLNPTHPSTPALLLKIAELCLEMGNLELALAEMDRAEAMATFLDPDLVA